MILMKKDAFRNYKCLERGCNKILFTVILYFNILRHICYFPTVYYCYKKEEHVNFSIIKFL